jgi:hypothetical protein
MQTILSYHPKISVGSKLITGNLNDYYTDDEILDSAKEQHEIKDLHHLLESLPMKLMGMGLLFIDSDIADNDL